MSKRKVLFCFLVGCFMTSISAWTITRGFQLGWLGIVFFGFTSMLLFVKLFKPALKWGLISGTSENQSEKEFHDRWNDDGVFHFFENGFTVKTKSGEQTILWTEVKSILGYKEDHLTTDSICLDVFCDRKHEFKLSEDTAGWYQFLDHSKKALLGMNELWNMEIVKPAFETNLTVVYDRENRLQEEIIKEHYQN